MLDKQLTEYRQRPNNVYVSEDRSDRLKVLTTKIATLRREGAYDSVAATLRQPTPNRNGVGLDEATILTHEKGRATRGFHV